MTDYGGPESGPVATKAPSGDPGEGPAAGAPVREPGRTREPDGGDITLARPSSTFERLTVGERHSFALRYSGLTSWAWDVRTDRVEADMAIYGLFGIPASQPLTAQAVIARIHPDDRMRIGAALEHTIATGQMYDERFRVTDADGRLRWLRGVGEVHRRYKDGDASVVIGLNMDITELVDSEQRLLAVIGEMRHRIKNSLTMVNSLAAATAREVDDIDQFVDKFRGRIDALASAQRAIGTTGETHLVDLRAAVEGAMAPFTETPDWGRRIAMQIVDVDIRPSLGQALALTIYELGTNAIKYGALLREHGTIRLQCQVDASCSFLRVEWHETHVGDEIGTRAESTGFGTLLIERLIQAEKGVIERSATDGGYSVALTFPLS